MLKNVRNAYLKEQEKCALPAALAFALQPAYLTVRA